MGSEVVEADVTFSGSEEMRFRRMEGNALDCAGSFTEGGLTAVTGELVNKNGLVGGYSRLVTVPFYDI